MTVNVKCDDAGIAVAIVHAHGLGPFAASL
jgi:hypothetical protein